MFPLMANEHRCQATTTWTGNLCFIAGSVNFPVEHNDGYSLILL
jgi:hypothetical protein